MSLPKGFKHSEETKAKMRATALQNGNIPSYLGYKHSEESKRKMSQSHSGHTYNRGRKHSEKTIEANRLRMKKWHEENEHPRGMTGKKAWNKGVEMPQIRGENHPSWKGGYKNKLFHSRQRKFNKKANGGLHSFEEWNNLKKFYGFMCLCCKQREPLVKLTEDHITPISMGGSNDISNIQPLCQPCNSLKWTKVIDYRLLKTA